MQLQLLQWLMKAPANAIAKTANAQLNHTVDATLKKAAHVQLAPAVQTVLVDQGNKKIVKNDKRDLKDIRDIEYVLFVF